MTATILILAATLGTTMAADDPGSPKPEAVRGAVEKALPLILKSTAQYPESRDCFSCHHQAVPVLGRSPRRGRKSSPSRKERSPGRSS